MKKYLIIPFIVLSMVACNQKAEHNDNELEKQETTEQHNHNRESINLDNGKKWKVAESMAVYIHNMETAVIDFENSVDKDYVALAQTIDNNIKELTSNCTMEGQAHDELHKWLVPFIELSEKFNTATEPIEQEKIYQELKKSFVEYDSYFE